jgi:hypothetical protein
MHLIREMISNIETGDNMSAISIFEQLMEEKVSNLLHEAKIVVAETMFNADECVECDNEE